MTNGKWKCPRFLLKVPKLNVMVLVYSLEFLSSPSSDVTAADLGARQKLQQSQCHWSSAAHCDLTIPNFGSSLHKSCFLAVHNSSIGDLVTDSLSQGTFTFDIQRAPLETCDLWYLWSEWWGDITWLTKRQWQRQKQRQWQWQTQIHLENTFKEQS